MTATETEALKEPPGRADPGEPREAGDYQLGTGGVVSTGYVAAPVDALIPWLVSVDLATLVVVELGV